MFVVCCLLFFVGNVNVNVNDNVNVGWLVGCLWLWLWSSSSLSLLSFLWLLLLLLSSVLLVVGRCGSILLRLPRYFCAPTGRLAEEVAVLQQLNECIEQNANEEVPKKSCGIQKQHPCMHMTSSSYWF